MLSVNMYAKVWKVEEPKEGKKSYTAQISTSTKKDDGSYETDFSSFVTICGKACETKLEVGDTFQVKKFAVSNHYDKEKKVTYYNFLINEIDNVKHSKAEMELEPVETDQMPF